jgi:hypothetical protein
MFISWRRLDAVKRPGFPDAILQGRHFDPLSGPLGEVLIEAPELISP